MKKTIMILALILSLAAPSHAAGIIDKTLYKRVVLQNSNGAVVMVNRLTGRVVCVVSNGQKVALSENNQKQFQLVYEAQERLQ